MIAIPTKARPAGSVGQPQYKLDATNFGGMSGVNWDSATTTWTFGSTVSVKYTSSAGGAITVQAPAIAGNAVITWPATSGQLAKLDANTFTDSQTIISGTKTASAPIISGTQTWNNGAVPFDADLINVTNTASAFTSYLLRRQIGGVDKFRVSKTADVYAGDSAGSVSGPSYSFLGDGTSGMGWISGNLLLFQSSVICLALADSLKEFRVPKNYVFAWSSSTSNNASAHTSISSPAAAIVQLGGADSASPVSPQTLRPTGARAGIDNNVSGASLTVTSGGGTGLAAGSKIIFKTPVVGATGTAAQVQTTTLTLNDGQATFAGAVTVSAGGVTVSAGGVRTVPVTVGTLPSAAASGDGTRNFVNDATMTSATGLGGAVVGGGANKVGVIVANSTWVYG